MFNTLKTDEEIHHWHHTDLSYQ